MKCKKCKAQLPENAAVCPECGEQTAAEKAGMSTTTKLTIVIAALVVLIAVLVGVIVMGMGGVGGNEDTTGAPDTTAAAQADPTTPTDGDPDNETCKGTYTDLDEAVMAANTEVVATMGEYELTNGEFQVYYWMSVYNFLNYNSSYISYYGLDLTQSLDTQTCSLLENGGTWQQYFVKQAVEAWQRFRGLADMAQEAGFEMEEEYAAELEALRTNMESTVTESGYESLEEMMADQLGGGCTFADYESYMYEYYMGYLYYNTLCEQITVTDDEIAAFYQEHKADYETNGLTEDMTQVDVRHILLQPEGCTFDDNNYVVATDEQWEACRAQAQAMLDDWLANDGTEEGFAALAKEHTADGNGEEGGLYEGVQEGQMVQTFNDWIFEPSRVYGDSGLVKTEFGYHIMYFVESELMWPIYAEEDLMVSKQDELMQSAIESHPVEVSYDKILVANVVLVSES